MTTAPTVVDALSLGAAVADDLLVATARDTHEAISRRVHGAVRLGVGPLGVPVEALHRGIAGTVYAALGLTFRGASIGLGKLAESGVGPALEDGPRGRFVNAAVNGLIGDEIRRERPRLAIEMAVRHDGRDVPLTAAGLARAFPDASGRIVVFLHGLCENEAYWRRHRDQVGTTYGESLATRGWTPVYIRANTGLPLRENGVILASLMQRLVEAWPGDIERIALVGHSLGGLIVRAASAVMNGVGDVEGPDRVAPAPWSDKVTDVVTLGTPHLGSWFAVGADHASRHSARLPETAAFGRIIDRQAPGIHDLIEGLAHDVPPLPHARYRLVSATLTTSARHPVAQLIGDLLVTPRSAVGRDRRGTVLFPDAEVLHLPRTDHFGLLNHPDVHEALTRWLA